MKVMTEMPVKRPRVPPMADIWSKMLVRSSRLIWVMMGVSKKKFRMARSFLKQYLVSYCKRNQGGD